MPRRLVIIIPLLLALVGCSSPMLDFSLSFKAAPDQMPPLPYSVAVRPFRDLRPQARASANRKWLGLIPGVLWVDIPTDIPEIYTVFTPYASRPLPRNVAEALAGGLAGAKVFRRVSFDDGEGVGSDFILTGRVKRSRLTERCYYYGSFMYAWLTRVFALPYVSFTIEMDYDVRLIRVSDGAEVWRRGFSHAVSDRYHSVYELGRGRGGKHLLSALFSRIIADDFPAIRAGIRAALAEEGR